MLDSLTQHPLAPFLVGTLVVALLVQIYKAALRAGGVRHHPFAERTLSLVPALVGGALFGVFPHELAVPKLIDGGHYSTHVLGVLIGLGAGFASSGVFRAALDAAPEKVRKNLTLPDSNQGA